MKVGIIFAILLMSLTVGERQPRSTVLTDESKRVLEHFDFSNFDKQEALNYLDRQRHENQIRGKRSQFKFKRAHNDRNNGKASDATLKSTDHRRDTDSKKSVKFQLKNTVTGIEYPRESTENLNSQTNVRTKRRRRFRKRHRSKLKHRHESEYVDEDEEEQREFRRRRRKKKKRHYWNHWSDWSPCSVTCGRGRKIRWRRCIAKNCTTGEVEMGEKTCQLPACNLLTKLLGL